MRICSLQAGAHFMDSLLLALSSPLDLCCLLSELSCESLYLFLLLSDRCFQFLNFAIEHGLVLGASP